ncbi:hypothetical protein BC629DRAFT_1684279 [Irpex lacteus]|nr:hypothetical protein BC629DRAFT_1684279 [Irpex lacteus]
MLPPSGLSYIFRLPVFTSSVESTALSYSQLPATELLVLLSFVFLLNVVRLVADYVLHAGIIAEIILGSVYGTPLGAILPEAWETTFTALGYLGLIGLVFEGGLSTDLPALLANLPLSMSCATLGVALPIAFSFALLQAGFGCRPLEAFAAGSALASTSLGTTLMALNSVSPKEGQQQGISQTNAATGSQKKEQNEIEITAPPVRSPQRSRIGTVLISAAVIDDVIGLVLASLVPVLSATAKPNEQKSHSALLWAIIRPIFSSVLMALVTAVTARFVLRPAFWFRDIGERWCAPAKPGKPWGFKRRSLDSPRETTRHGFGTRGHALADAVQLTFAVLSISAFSAIAFYTGSSVLYGAYLAGLTLTYIAQPPEGSSDDTKQSRINALSFEKMYSRTVTPLQDHLLAPLFFASIGFSIPFRALWRPAILWRGVVYSILMCIAKLATGLPVLCWSLWSTSRRIRLARENCSPAQVPFVPDPCLSTGSASATPQDVVERAIRSNNTLARDRYATIHDSRGASLSSSPSLLSHFAPALFLGIAMVSRGEIGLLVVQIAHDPQSSLLGDDTYLIAVWSILLCTLVGPIGVGIVVRRWGKWLQRGIWGD